MTEPTPTYDDSSYSARDCRCGASMRRNITQGSRYGWTCTACGRQQRH